MTFLSLGTALFAAAFAVPLLLALYVLKLRRRSLRTSTIAFWQAASADAQANVPFQRLRASWMLALHLALLACLLLALARPVLESQGKGEASRTVILIDTSASMQARDSLDGSLPTQATPTRLDRAKTRAKALVREIRRGANSPVIAVVAVGAQSEAVLGFSSSVPLLDAAIEAIEPTDQPGDLPGALRLVESLATQASDQGEEDDVEQGGLAAGGATRSGAAQARAKQESVMRANVAAVLVSDGSFDTTSNTSVASNAQTSQSGAGQSDTGQQTPESSSLSVVPLRFERIGPPLTAPAAPSAPTVEALGGTATRNVGIVRIAAQRDAKIPRKVRLLVALTNNAPQEAPVTLTIALDGEVKQRSATMIPAARVTQQEFEESKNDQADALAPQDTRAMTNARDTTSGTTSGTASNATGTTNAAQAGTRKAARASKQLGEQEIVIDVDDVASGLISVVLDVGAGADALVSDNTASIMLLAQRSPSIVVLRSQLAAGEANPLRFLLMDVLEELRPARLEERVLQAGASERDVEELLRVEGAWADVAVLDDLSLSGLPAVPVIVLGGEAPALGVSRVGEAKAWSGLVFWERQHPLLQGVGLDSLVLSKRLALQTTSQTQGEQEATKPQSPWRHDVLARDGDEPLIVLAQPRTLADGAGVRHIVTGFSLMESNWPLSPSFAIFLANAVDSLSLRDAARVGKAMTTSVSGQVRVPASGAVRLVGPVERELRAGEDMNASGSPVGTVTRASAPVLIATGVLSRAGLYRVEHEGLQTEQASEQSVEQSIERVLAVNVVNEHESAAASPRQLQFEGSGLAQQTSGGSQRELWPLLLVVALVLLTVEWIVFAGQTRS